MLSTIIRTLIIYFAVLTSVRLMGKRQLGELQPGELVITILISEIAAMPITDASIPMLQSLIPLMLLVSLEIINSVLTRKNLHFRNITDGRPIAVIENGELKQGALKELRFTIDDILAALRQKDVFNIEDVDEAIVETNGTLSVLLKPSKRNTTPDSLKKPEKDCGVPIPLIIDGDILDSSLKSANLKLEDVYKEITKEGLKKENILLMTVNKNKEYYFLLKEEC